MSTRFARTTVAPLTVNTCSSFAREPAASGSLNAIRTENPRSPSCASGTDAKLAVSAGATGSTGPGAGPGTNSARPLATSAWPSAVHSAPASVHARPGGTRIDTAPLPDGASVSSHRSLRPSTRAASVTVAPLTASAWSRMSAGVISTSSLKATQTLKALEPSWLAGAPWKPAISGPVPVAGAVSPSSSRTILTP